MPEYFIGLMSGTSLDGVDGVLVDFSQPPMALVQHVSTPLAPALRAELLALNSASDNELHRAALAANALARTYARVVAQLLEATALPASAVRAIGVHGQTVRHRPGEFDAADAHPLPATGYTLQLNNPALLAELTGMDVVADFRSRDVAAGGQGAPLVPAFHQAIFGQTHQAVAVLNIGGISNISVLPPGQPVTGFDCGPGNALLDYWCQLHTGQPFDAGGAWAASGQVIPALLHSLLADAFFAKPPPKSTGRDLFNPAWLHERLAHVAATPVDVQATLTEFTAVTCCDSVKRFAPHCKLLLVCGGGAFNTYLLQRLQQGLPGVAVDTSKHHGLPPLQVEASAFAWLASRTLQRQSGSMASVTGARGDRVLGAIYLA